MKKRVSINLVTSKAQPSIKPKQLQFPNAFTYSLSNQNQNFKNPDSLQDSLQTNQVFSSAKSQRLVSLYSYQAENEIRIQPKSSQQILDRANDINNQEGSPINQKNLQMVNQHVISHFQKISKQTNQNGVYTNYLYYKEKIDKALSRSAENMSRYNQSISQRKREFKDSKLSDQRSFTQSETLPSNPLNKIRKNRFSTDNHHFKRGYSQSYTEERNFKQKVPYSKNENLNSFDGLSKNSRNSIAQFSENVGGLSKCESELQKQLKEKDEIIRNLQNQNNRLETNYNDLLSQSQKSQDQEALKQLNIQLQKNIAEIKELQKYKIRNQDQQNFKSQINAILVENQNIYKQKQELESILKEVLLQNEKFRQLKDYSVNISTKNEPILNRKHINDSFDHSEEISTTGEYGVVKKSKRNLQLNHSNDISIENKYSSFDLSRSSVPNKTSEEISTIQDSWISASFQTYSRQTPSEDVPLNVSLNLQLLNQFNDTDIVLQQRKKDYHPQKRLEKNCKQKQDAKISSINKQQPSRQSSKQKQSQARKNHGIKDKENKLPHN